VKPGVACCGFLRGELWSLCGAIVVLMRGRDSCQAYRRIDDRTTWRCNYEAPDAIFVEDQNVWLLAAYY
jgi:hypothetical protein